MCALLAETKLPYFLQLYCINVGRNDAAQLDTYTGKEVKRSLTQTMAILE